MDKVAPKDPMLKGALLILIIWTPPLLLQLYHKMAGYRNSKGIKSMKHPFCNAIRCGLSTKQSNSNAKHGSKVSHLPTVRAERADPLPYGEPYWWQTVQQLSQMFTSTMKDFPLSQYFYFLWFFAKFPCMKNFLLVLHYNSVRQIDRGLRWPEVGSIPSVLVFIPPVSHQES